MSTLQAVPDLSVEDLRAEVRKEYADVAEDPVKGYHFHTGREAATRLGYDEALYSHTLEGNIESFAGIRHTRGQPSRTQAGLEN